MKRRYEYGVKTLMAKQIEGVYDAVLALTLKHIYEPTTLQSITFGE